jgi:hypothetical protein
MTIDGLPSVPVTAPQMTHAPILAATQKAPTGWYEIELAPNQVQGLRTGKFPALALTTQTSKGFWKKREKTIATITPVRNGNFAVTMKFNVRPDAHSAVAIDLGQGNLVHIGGDIVARDGRIVEAPVDAKQYGRKQYAILTKTFLQKPAAVLLAIRKIAPIAVPAGIGFMAGGPVGAAFGGGLPFARNFISAKLMRLQMPQEEIMAPHVQYVLGDQQDKIRTLEQELAGIKKQLAALSLSAHETQTTKEGK